MLRRRRYIVDVGSSVGELAEKSILILDGTRPIRVVSFGQHSANLLLEDGPVEESSATSRSSVHANPMFTFHVNSDPLVHLQLGWNEDSAWCRDSALMLSKCCIKLS